MFDLNVGLIFLGLACGLIYVFVCFAKPFYVTLAIAFALILGPFLSIPFTSEGFLLSLALLFTAFMAWIAKALMAKDSALFAMPLSRPANVMVIVLLMVMVISVKNSSHIGVSISAIKRFMYCLAIYFFMIYSIKDERQLRAVIHAMIPAYLVIALLGIFEAASGKLIYEITGGKSILGSDVSSSVLHISERGRIQGVMGNAEFHSFRMLCFLILSLYILFSFKSKLVKLLAVFIILTAMFNIVGVAYRGAVLALSVSMMAYFILLRLKYKWLIFGSAFSTIVVLGVCVYFMIPDLNIERLVKTEGQAVETVVMRKNNTIIGLNMALDNPLFGQGPEGFVLKYDYYARGFPETRKEETKTHNTYVQIMAEYGFIGFCVFVSILALTLKNLFFIVRKLEGVSHYLTMSVFAAMCAYTTIMIGANVLLDHNFWLLISIAAVCDKIYGKKRSDDSLQKAS